MDRSVAIPAIRATPILTLPSALVFCREVAVGGEIPIDEREDIEKTDPRE
jgi:hypothetical protein